LILIYPDEIIKDLSKNVRREESGLILAAIAKRDQEVSKSQLKGYLFGLDQAQIIRETGLSIAIVGRTLSELKGAGFVKVNRQQYGRSSHYNLTDNGRRLVELYNQEAKR
jgi:DNA-binding MarR family transcriptional regulator